MIKLSARGAVICAVLPLGLMLTACSGIGEAGYHKVVAGNWEGAKADFADDYQSHPEHPIAVFNMGAAHHHDGNVNQADAMFAEAATRGRGYVPGMSLEPEGVTVAEHACARLHRDSKLDANCGDRIVAIVTPPPAPVAQAAEPEPSIQAQATEVPKQDRN